MKISAALTWAMFLFIGMAHAESADDRRAGREREVARRAQAQMQKFEAENSQLQQQLTELQKKQTDELQQKAKATAALHRQLGDTKKREDALAKELQESRELVARTQGLLEEQKKQNAELSRQLAESVGEGKRLAGELGDAKTQLVQQRQTIDEQSQALQDTSDKNLALYRLNVELLDRYNRKGVWDALLQREPFTQVKDVRTQALVEEYRDKLDAQKATAGRLPK
jgi:chromosome segregation ATPase